MAFRRTIFKLAREDVAPALKKMWKKHYQVDGMVSQHLSPFEQKIVSPMFKDAHVKIMKKLAEMAVEAGPGLLTGYAVYVWADSKFAEIAFHHRP